jgi:hypothetical protein
MQLVQNGIKKLQKQRNSPGNKYPHNQLAKETSVKSSLELLLNNLLEETQK